MDCIIVEIHEYLHNVLFNPENTDLIPNLLA